MSCVQNLACYPQGREHLHANCMIDLLWSVGNKAGEHGTRSEGNRSALRRMTTLCGLVGHLVEVEELVMPAHATYWRPVVMGPVDRPSGQNDVGVVAWLLTLKTPECPQGRQVGGCRPQTAPKESQVLSLLE